LADWYLKFLKDFKDYKSDQTVYLIVNNKMAQYLISSGVAFEPEDGAKEYRRQQKIKNPEPPTEIDKQIAKEIQKTYDNPPENMDKIRKPDLEIWDYRYDDDGKILSKKLNIVNISLNFLETFQIITVGDDRFDMYYYDVLKGIYEKSGEKIVHRYVQAQTEGEITTHQINEIIGQVQRQTYEDRDILINKNNEMVCVGNGILNVNTLELIPHTHTQIFTQRLEWNYKKDVDCPLIKKFLGEILVEEDIKVLQEFVGYCFY